MQGLTWCRGKTWQTANGSPSWHQRSALACGTHAHVCSRTVCCGAGAGCDATSQPRLASLRRIPGLRRNPFAGWGERAQISACVREELRYRRADGQAGGGILTCFPTPPLTNHFLFRVSNFCSFLSVSLLLSRVSRFAGTIGVPKRIREWKPLQVRGGGG